MYRKKRRINFCIKLTIATNKQEKTENSKFIKQTGSQSEFYVTL